MMPSITAVVCFEQRTINRPAGSSAAFRCTRHPAPVSSSEPSASPATPALVDKFRGRRRSRRRAPASGQALALGLLVQQRTDVPIGKPGRDRNGARHTVARLAPEASGVASAVVITSRRSDEQDSCLSISDRRPEYHSDGRSRRAGAAESSLRTASIRAAISASLGRFSWYSRASTWFARLPRA